MTDPLLNFNKTKIDLHIVQRKQSVEKTMHILSFIVSVITIAAIVFYHGCYMTSFVASLIRGLVYASLIFYIFKYFLLMFYSLHKSKYIKKSWFEFTIIVVLLLHFILFSLFGFDLFDLYKYENIYML